MYALVEIAGKQYKAQKGKTLIVDRLDKNEGERVEFTSVLLLAEDDKVKIGTPYCEGAKVKTTVSKQTKGPKVIIYKYKRRKDYRRKRGFRPSYTVLTVEEIEAPGI